MLRGFIHHQSTLFSAVNVDTAFFQCLASRLGALLVGSDPERDEVERQVVIDV